LNDSTNACRSACQPAEVERDSVLVCPVVERPRDELRPIVHTDAQQQRRLIWPMRHVPHRRPIHAECQATAPFDDTVDAWTYATSSCRRPGGRALLTERPAAPRTERRSAPKSPSGGSPLPPACLSPPASAQTRSARLYAASSLAPVPPRRYSQGRKTNLKPDEKQGDVRGSRGMLSVSDRSLTQAQMVKIYDFGTELGRDESIRHRS
jgi:hypothetical protein